MHVAQKSAAVLGERHASRNNSLKRDARSPVCAARFERARQGTDMGEEKSGLIAGADGVLRCAWPGSDEFYQRYHDNEWGHPVADDFRLFEKICLEGFQSGLSWITILRKRENFRKAFAAFDFNRVAEFTEKDVERLLQDAGIIRHRGKIESTINNAKRAKELMKEAGSLAAFFWKFEPQPHQRPARLDRATLLMMPKT